MGFLRAQVVFFLLILAVPLFSFSADQIADGTIVCEESEFTQVSYEDLRAKMETTLREKNKSLVLLDYKALQAQIDVLISHLTTEDTLSNLEARELLKKTGSYLEQLGGLLDKAKESAKHIKENHVVPLAALTSLKAEQDKCEGKKSQFHDIFRVLSQLNKDFNEILMMSPQRIEAQKDQVISLIKKLGDENQDNSSVSSHAIAESLNFIQNQINGITSTFQFDAKSLQTATID